uniref:Uncharacterized protein n=1 Tax=Anguilla anguilla TaxID=7936 RepID=A0A0E9PHB7_ANGAN
MLGKNPVMAQLRSSLRSVW